MTGFQFLVLLTAAGLVVSAFWGKIGSFIVTKLPAEKKDEIKPSPDKKPDIVHEDCEELVDVISSWSHLKECCEAQGLKQAVIELEKIFPLFVVKS